MKMIYLIISVTLLFTLVIVFSSYSSVKTEEQAYRLIAKEGDFEIRFYPQAVMASVKMTGSYDNSKNSGFRTLAGYIFGGNQQQMKISMTAPVRMNEDENSSTMSFVMPAELSYDGLPKPNSADIILHTTEPVYAATFRFGGYASDEKIAEVIEKLDKLLKAKGLKHSGKFEFLGYNPPYQFINRRNEILVGLTDYMEQNKF